MTKNIKRIIISTLILILLVSQMSCLIGSYSFAESIGGVDVKINDNPNGKTEVINVSNKVLGVIKVVGILLAVGIIMVLGLKYMMGSAEEKADYKKSMIPYFVGAVILFLATTIAPMVYNLVTGITTT